jgi:predicted RNase H-like nuclease (RuvC/YqgF family)
MGNGSEIVGMPGINQLGPWVIVAILMVPKIMDWWERLRGKKLDSDATIRTADVSVEIERIRGDFDRQKDFQDDLIAECQKLRDECKALRDYNAVLTGSIIERDAIIRERDGTIANMQKELDQLRHEVDVLKRHVKAIEEDRDKLKKSCPILPVVDTVNIELPK